MFKIQKFKDSLQHNLIQIGLTCKFKHHFGTDK